MSGAEHFQSARGYVGDVMPFVEDGVLHLFYLRAPREPQRDGTRHLEIAHAVSRDLVRWEEWLDVMRGDHPYDRHGTWTGSVIQAGGEYHFFYTGVTNPDAGFRSPQVICRARSRDLIHWQKDARNPVLRPDAGRFTPIHWRDPVVIHWPERELYLMTVSTALKDIHGARAGAVVRLTSPDLETWSEPEVILQPGVWVPECSRLLQAGRRWYLTYHVWERHAAGGTCHVAYVVGDNPRGPWRPIGDSRLDGGQLSAGKTVAFNDRILYLGNVPTRVGNSDQGDWQWGGALAYPRQLRPQPDGALAVALAEEVARVLPYPSAPVTLQAESGTWTRLDDGWRCEAEWLGLAQLPASSSDTFAINLAISSQAARRTGVVLRMKPMEAGWEATRLDQYPWPGYEVCLDYTGRRLRVCPTGTATGEMAGCPLDDRDVHHLRVVLEKNFLEVFLDDVRALGTMLYRGIEGRGSALFTDGGRAQFRFTASE